jgi:hypothetical protein
MGDDDTPPAPITGNPVREEDDPDAADTLDPPYGWH